jgi:hypothetical protein
MALLRRPPAQPVEREVADDAIEIGHRLGAGGFVQARRVAQERLLHQILGLHAAADDGVGVVDQPAAMGEELRQVLLVVGRHVALCPPRARPAGSRPVPLAWPIRLECE